MVIKGVILMLRILRGIYTRIFGETYEKPDCIEDRDLSSRLIGDLLLEDKPCMIARFGSTEMLNLVNFLGVRHKDKFKSYKNYIQGKTPPWWWEESTINQLSNWSGVFPADIKTAEKFCELMLNDIPQVDVLGSWLPSEKYFEEYLIAAQKVELLTLDPYWAKEPWTHALEGKTVLVVHPFAETIKKQYAKREFLFANNLLPEFKLETVKAVQSIAGAKTHFTDWFDALAYMKEEIEKIDFDICLVGAGAYGFPLAAHVKRMGKKGFHLGGSLQLLFGIRGKRWENENYYDYHKLINEYWVRPDGDEKPTNAVTVEGGCYW